MITKSIKYLVLTLIACCGASVAMAQENTKTVTGTVVDAATGEPLPGVIVVAYGHPRYSAMTNEQGLYELKVPDYTRSVTMRLEGFCLQQNAIVDDAADSGRAVANAKLYSQDFTGHYAESTHATISAEANRFDNNAELSIDPLIAQQLGADMRSVSHGGIPGMGNLMLIQGINSLHANAQPLVVIDGVIMDMQYTRSMLHDGYFNNLLANLNVNDIETVTVLKNGTAL